MLCLSAGAAAQVYRQAVDGCATSAHSNALPTQTLNPLLPMAVRCCSADGAVCVSEAGGACLPLQVPHAAAAEACAALGLRLCTAAELVSGMCCGTGCGYDERLIWASDATATPTPTATATPSHVPWYFLQASGACVSATESQCQGLSNFTESERTIRRPRGCYYDLASGEHRYNSHWRSDCAAGRPCVCVEQHVTSNSSDCGNGCLGEPDWNSHGIPTVATCAKRCAPSTARAFTPSPQLCHVGLFHSCGGSLLPPFLSLGHILL